ncbi:MAG: ExbD/TolR family protein, partial [Planctomycetota bacterium]
LIDIVFLLLVFFVVTTSMGYLEREMSVSLPEAQSATKAESRYNEIVVNITKAGTVVVNRATLTPKRLEERLKRLAALADGAVPGVIIRADEDCPHKHVVRVMDVCARASVKHVFFGTAGGGRVAHASR